MSELSCIWKGREHPRALRDRHVEGCEDETCRGCQDCYLTHCVICGINHVSEQTCPECVGNIRTGLIEIQSLYAQLPAQALYGGSNGKLEAARPIPGGEAAVLLAPSSNGRAVAWARERGDDVSHKADERIGEIDSPELMLVTWEDDWRSIRNQSTKEPASLSGAANYLNEHLHWAAQHHDAFDAFANDIRSQVGRLEDVLHAGEREERTAPCLYCRGRIERIYHQTTGFSDNYRCVGKCRRPYTREQYLNACRAGYLAAAKVLTAADASIRLGVPASRIRVWGSRFPELKSGKSDTGLWLYKMSDLAAKIEADERETVADSAWGSEANPTANDRHDGT